MMQELTVYPETAHDVSIQIQEAVVDHQSFEQPVTPCSLAKCKATCCYDGVYLGAEEVEIIKIIVDREEKKGTWERFGLTNATGAPLTPETVLTTTPKGREKTQTREALPGELPPSFPTHFNKTRCVFLDTQGRCGFQRLAMEEGKHPWFYKPITCWIHPIALAPPQNTETRARLTLYNSSNDPHKEEGYPGFCSHTPCGKIDSQGAPAKEALKEELLYLSKISGRNVFKEIHTNSL